MPKSANQKMKILLLLRMLWEKTDEEHPMSMAEIIRRLEEEGVNAERKSIYSDFQTLRDLDFDVCYQGGADGGYYIGSRNFEMAELKILADSIQASRFLSEKKSRGLIRKLSSLCSEGEARQLERTVLLSSSVKDVNEAIFYNVDAIHRAIGEDSLIAFRYFHYGASKEKEYHYEGHHIKTNPVALVWDDENYYLVAWDSSWHRIRNYRVDRMEDIKLTGEPRREKDKIEEIDLKNYASVNFSMFAGERQKVSIVFSESLIGVMLDRFGRDLTLYPQENGEYAIHPEVAVSPQFFGWLFGLNGDARLTAPASAVEKMREQLRKVTAAHDGAEDSFS